MNFNIYRLKVILLFYFLSLMWAISSDTNIVDNIYDYKEEEESDETIERLFEIKKEITSSAIKELFESSEKIKSSSTKELLESTKEMISSANDESNTNIMPYLAVILSVIIIFAIIIGLILRSKSLKVCQALETYEYCRQIKGSKLLRCVDDVKNAVIGKPLRKFDTSTKETKPLVSNEPDIGSKCKREQMREMFIREEKALQRLRPESQSNQSKELMKANKIRENTFSTGNKDRSQKPLIDIEGKENKRSKLNREFEI